jgi:hypothetical protein
LCVHEVVDQNIVASHGVGRLVLDDLLLELAHVLLVEGVRVVGNVTGDLYRSETFGIEIRQLYPDVVR